MKYTVGGNTNAATVINDAWYMFKHYFLPLSHKWGGELMIVNIMHAGTLDVRLIQWYNQMACLVLTAKINYLLTAKEN